MDPFREVDAGALERLARLEDENEELRRRLAALEAEKTKSESGKLARAELERELEQARTEVVAERMRAADLAKRPGVKLSPIQAFCVGAVFGFLVAMIIRR